MNSWNRSFLIRHSLQIMIENASNENLNIQQISIDHMVNSNIFFKTKHE